MESVNTTREEVLGRRNPQQKDWISAETIRKIQIRSKQTNGTLSRDLLRRLKGQLSAGT